MVLFLDVDGVLHPEPVLFRHAFCRLPLVEEILMDFPQVEIVISSVWRLDWQEESAQIAGMKEHFSMALRDRVVGVTPNHRQTPVSQAPEGLSGYLREWECLACAFSANPDIPTLSDTRRAFRVSERVGMSGLAENAQATGYALCDPG